MRAAILLSGFQLSAHTLCTVASERRTCLLWPMASLQNLLAECGFNKDWCLCERVQNIVSSETLLILVVLSDREPGSVKHVKGRCHTPCIATTAGPLPASLFCFDCMVCCELKSMWTSSSSFMVFGVMDCDPGYSEPALISAKRTESSTTQ